MSAMLIEFKQVAVGKIDRMGGVNGSYLGTALLIEQALAVRNSEVVAEHLMDFVVALSGDLARQTCDAPMDKIVETCSFWSTCFHRLADQDDELAAHIANTAVYTMNRDKSYFEPFKYAVDDAVLRICRDVDTEDMDQLKLTLFNLEHVLYRSAVTYTEGRSSDSFMQASLRWGNLLEEISPQERYGRVSYWNQQMKRNPHIGREFEKLTDRLLRKAALDEEGKGVISNGVCRMIGSSLSLKGREVVVDSSAKDANQEKQERKGSIRHLRLVTPDEFREP